MGTGALFSGILPASPLQSSIIPGYMTDTDGSGELNSDEQARLFEVYDPYTGTSLPRAALIAYAEAAAAAPAPLFA